MAGLVVQHNMSALNANNKMNTNVAGLKKATEKLSSGYQINRAGDNAAGLAISEKMRSQIRGLAQATRNANDGISLIQTAEGGLNETHSILQRMRELAVQSANGTYQNDTDREAIQLEVDALKSEIDRISTATEYNGMQLLDGSLGGSSTVNEFGPKYGAVSAVNGALKGATITSNVAGVSIVANALGATGKGAENAYWSEDGKTLTLNLNKNTTYSQDQIDKLIENAIVPKSATAVPAEVNVKLVNGIMTTAAATDGATTATVGGTRTTASVDLTNVASTAPAGAVTAAGTGKWYSDEIQFAANTYGTDTKTGAVTKITINTANVDAGKESVVEDATTTTEITINLATGKEYTEADIEKILKDAGYDFTVNLKSTATGAPMSDQNGVVYFSKSTNANSEDNAGSIAFAAGKGVGKDADLATGKGLTFQIGANGVEDQRVTLYVDDMSSKAIGVANADVSTRDAANEAIKAVDAAVKKVSMQRAGLGALQNRLEYTVNNLTTTNENLTNAESQIRDTDMATEMINYTKFNILQQASQAMLAQANQQPQAVLQLLG